jgi:hypothetical protein
VLKVIEPHNLQIQFAKDNLMPKKLTATPRVVYESYKNTKSALPEAQKDLRESKHLDRASQHFLRTPDNYVKLITLDESSTLGTFLNKIITLGSTQSFVCFMMLYQYLYDKNLLGKEVEKITCQDVINHIYKDKKYTLKPKDKQAFFKSILHLSGLKFYIKNPKRTEEIQREAFSGHDVIFSSALLVKVKEIQTAADESTIKCLRGVSIMKDFVDLFYKSLSRLYIPLEDILKISSDHNGNHKRGFNLSLALRHAELGSKNDSLEWTLEQCLNVGQWKTNPKFKNRAWAIVIASLEAGKSQELIDYKLVYYKNKPKKALHIEKVVIYRLWKSTCESLTLGFEPENIEVPTMHIKSQWE